MLGVQDFCGYYDWTFDHFRKHFGQGAVKELWAIAIGTDSQRHYIESGKRDGLKGLFDTWYDTGVDEKCDWTFTLDESRNVLRWDMRKCPSKGFLLQNNLHADEDYCDHCIGWVKSALGTIDMEMVRHEHNHCGQCWGEMRVKGKPYQSPEIDCDIRNDSRWNHGQLDRFIDQEKAALYPSVSTSADSLQVIRDWLANRHVRLVEDVNRFASIADSECPLVSAAHYVSDTLTVTTRCLVLIETPPAETTLRLLAEKIGMIPPAEHPLLLYPYLPQFVEVPFASIGLQRPLSILPMLIRLDLYKHEPQKLLPTSLGWMQRIAKALSYKAAEANPATT